MENGTCAYPHKRFIEGSELHEESDKVCLPEDLLCQFVIVFRERTETLDGNRKDMGRRFGGRLEHAKEENGKAIDSLCNVVENRDAGFAQGFDQSDDTVNKQPEEGLFVILQLSQGGRFNGRNDL